MQQFPNQTYICDMNECIEMTHYKFSMWELGVLGSNPTTLITHPYTIPYHIYIYSYTLCMWKLFTNPFKCKQIYISKYMNLVI